MNKAIRLVWLILIGVIVYLGLYFGQSQESSHALSQGEVSAQDKARETRPSATHLPGEALEHLPQEERIAALRESIERSNLRLSALSSLQLIPEMGVAFRRGDDIALNGAKERLLTAAKGGDDAAVSGMTTAIRAGLPELRAILIETLGRAATKGSLMALLDLLNDPVAQDATNRHGILSAIAGIGKYRDATVNIETLSSLLEQKWETVISLNDVSLSLSLARGIGSLGATNGVEKLLQSIDDTQLADPVRTAARDGLLWIRNSSAAIPLAMRLHSNPSLSATATRAAGAALAAMGTESATAAILDWTTQITSDSATDQALEWLSQVRDDASLALLQQAPERYSFRNADLGEKISQLATAIDHDTTPE